MTTTGKDAGWKLTKWGGKQAFVPPIQATIYGRRETIFRGEVQGYYTQSECPKPFLKFAIETTRHRITFAIMPRQCDTALHPRQVKTLTPGKGVVEFTTGAIYKKPNYRTIEITELPPMERLANMQELQLAGLKYSTKATQKRMPGKRGRRPSYNPALLKRVEGSIKHHNGSLKAASEALGMSLAEVRKVHDAARHQKGRLTA